MVLEHPIDGDIAAYRGLANGAQEVAVDMAEAVSGNPERLRAARGAAGGQIDTAGSGGLRAVIG